MAQFQNPFLRGMLGAQDAAQRSTANQIGAVGGLLGLQNQQRQMDMAEQMAPLKLKLMQAQVGAAENPQPILKDLGGSIGVFDSKTLQQIGSLPKSATPDAALREQGSMRRHETPSGSAILGEQGSMQRHAIPSGSAQLGANVSMRGQNMVDARSREAAEQVRTPPGYMAVPGGLAPIPGGPATAKAQSSDVERVSAGYATRMSEAAKILGGLEQKGVGKPGLVESSAATVPVAGKLLSNVAMTPERQKYRQAQEDWVRAKLRKESGAVIADEEMDREIRVYFPQIGDSPQVVKQKADARAISESAMLQAAGRAANQAPTRRATDTQGWSIRAVE